MHINPGRGGQRPGAGRPPATDKRKNYSVKLTDAEIATLQAAAKAERLTVSEYIRRKCGL